MSRIARDRLGQRGAPAVSSSTSDGDGARRAARSLTTSAGSSALIGLLRRASGSQRVAIERPGRAAGRAAAGRRHRGVAIHPNQVAAARDRYRAAGGKSDGFDALRARRARPHRHAPLPRAGARQRRDQGAAGARRAPARTWSRTRVALANQLRAQLDAFWPGAARDLRRRRQPDRARLPASATPAPPTPAASARSASPASSPATATAAADSAAELLDRLRSAPASRAGELETEARRADRARRSSPRCAPLVEQIRLADQPDRAAPSAPTPTARSSAPCSATPRPSSPPPSLLAEIGDSRDRYPTSRHASPPTPAKRPSPSNPANASTPASAGPATNASATPSASSPTPAATATPGPHDIYQRARARGCDHPHAIRILGRAWTRVLWRMWPTNTPTTPTDTATSNASTKPGLTQGVSCGQLRALRPVLDDADVDARQVAHERRDQRAVEDLAPARLVRRARRRRR